MRKRLLSREDLPSGHPIYRPTSELNLFDFLDGLKRLEEGALRPLLHIEAAPTENKLFNINLGYAAYLVRILVQRSDPSRPLTLTISAEDNLVIDADLGDVTLDDDTVSTIAAAATVAGFSFRREGNSFTFTAPTRRIVTLSIYAIRRSDFFMVLCLTFGY